MTALVYQQVIKACDDLAVIVKNSLFEQGVLKRSMSEKQFVQLGISVKVLVIESLLAHSVQAYSPVSIAKRSGFYSGNNPESVGLTFRMHVEKVYPTLCLLGFLRQHKKGFYDRALRRGKRELFTATEKLLKFCLPPELPQNRFAQQLSWSNELLVQPETIPKREPIHISHKDPETGERKVFSVVEDVKTHEMFQRLETVNRRLESVWVDLDLPNEDWERLRNGWIDSRGDHHTLKLHKRRLHRIFHDEQFLTGGRFYGGWWQEIPSIFRRNIIIDGKETVECDFSNMNPSLLYAKLGLPIPSDAYSPIAGERHREVVKRAFNAMLNAGSSMSQPPKDLELASLGLSWSELVEKIIAFHKPLADAKFFFSGAGMWLMREDSQLAELVMLKFSEMGYACLPVHDSFIVHHGLEGELLDSMTQAFCRRYGVEPRIKIVKKKAESVEDDHQLLPLDVDEILKALDTPQDHRLEAFRSLRQRPAATLH